MISGLRLSNYRLEMDKNHNLNDFSYSVSHDLSSPLRIIREFSKRLLADLGDDVSEKQILYSSLIQDSVIKAEMLLQNIREYALVTQKEPEITESIHIKSDIIEPVILELKQDKTLFQDAEFEIIGADFTINTDVNYLKTVFSHLIKNAIFFQKEDQKARIHITCQKKDNQTLFSIKDNGIGITQDNHALIFRLSKVLDPQKYPKNRGVGLTMAQKIIEDIFNGTIYLESDQEGTVFHFSI